MEKGIEYLRRKLDRKRSRVLTRYKYYEMKNLARDLQISSPDFLRYWMPTLGWCAKAVDSLSDRLVFKGFKNDSFQLMEIYNMNNPDTLFSSAILGALIGSCSFIYIAEGDEYPRMQVIDGRDATGIIDETTGLLKEGYAVLERDENDRPVVEAYLKPYHTHIIYKDERREVDYEHAVPYPMLVPIIFRPDSMRPFGHSRISRACMDITNSAIRTIKRSEISAEFYSFPQKYVAGLSEEAEPMDKWKATMSSLLLFTKDSDGDKPTLGQFQQQTMTPHTEMLKMFASMFAGETGLTVDDLGFVSDNPSSAEAIKAAHENLRLTAARAQRCFGTGFINAGFLARSLMDNYGYQRSLLYMTTCAWEPIFTPDASMLSSIGDGAIKINQAIPGYFSRENLSELTGIEGATENDASAFPNSSQEEVEVNG